MQRGSNLRLPALITVWMLLLFLTGGCGEQSSPASSGADSDAPETSNGAEESLPGGKLLISAASDLTPVLEELVPLFEEQTGSVVEVNLGSTGQLAQQIQAGAPVDVFLAASAEAIEDLSPDRVVPGTQQVYARGRLVLWSASAADFHPGSLADLSGSQVDRVAIANPDHAPYGRAAREALESARLWEELQPKLVTAQNVRQAFQFAQSGNVDVALVALSLAIACKGEYELVPEDLHQPLEQTLTVVGGTTHEVLARRFADFMTGSEARGVLEEYGFQLP